MPECIWGSRRYTAFHLSDFVTHARYLSEFKCTNAAALKILMDDSRCM